MASSDSDSDSNSPPPSLVELSRRSITEILLPRIIAAVSATNSTPREVAVFVRTRSITVLEGSLNIDALLQEISMKEGPSPASKASIEALPLVRVIEPGSECPICLTEYEVNGEEGVKEMPCGHKLHSACIDKWLGIHGSCPVCRYRMPAEEKAETEERERDWWSVHFFFQGGERDSDPDLGLESGRDEEEDMDSNRDSANDIDDGNDELRTEEMEMDNID